MTGKGRQTFIKFLSEDHEAARRTYNAGAEEERLIAWGTMIGLEAAAHYAGLATLNRDLAELRRRDCGGEP